MGQVFNMLIIITYYYRHFSKTSTHFVKNLTLEVLMHKTN